MVSISIYKIFVLKFSSISLFIEYLLYRLPDNSISGNPAPWKLNSIHHHGYQLYCWFEVRSNTRPEGAQETVVEGMRYLIKRKDTYMKNKDTPVIFSDYPDVLTVEDLSRMLGISTKTAYKLLKEQKIKSITIGRTYRIPKVYLLQYLQITE